MTVAEENRDRVTEWLEKIVEAKNGKGIHTIRDEYHALFRPDAVLYVPGHTQISGNHVGFDGWHAMSSRAFEIAAKNVRIELEQVVANETVCAAIIQYTFERDDMTVQTRATELRWFGDDGLVYEGEFMASNWPMFAELFA